MAEDYFVGPAGNFLLQECTQEQLISIIKTTCGHVEQLSDRLQAAWAEVDRLRENPMHHVEMKFFSKDGQMIREETMYLSDYDPYEYDGR